MNTSNGIKKIFLILGDGCNMSCAYCKAHLNSTKSQMGVTYPSGAVMAYLKNTIANEPTLINFYGGEPLLYFDVIKYIIDSINAKQDDVIWSTMTNGKSITPAMVEYFNKHKVTVNLSWDGEQTKTLRGYDVFADNAIKDYLLDIDDLWINSTLTSLTSPLEIANSHIPHLAEYQKRHGHSYGIHIGLATPTSANDPLYQYDYQKIYKEMQYIIAKGIFESLAKEPKDFSPIDCIARTLSFTFQKKARGTRDICLDMDIKGNFFLCPFSRKTVDTLNTLDSYIIKAKELMIARHCTKNCPVHMICDGGCPQLKDTPLGIEGCELRRAYYMPMIELVTGKLYEKYKEGYFENW